MSSSYKGKSSILKGTLISLGVMLLVTAILTLAISAVVMMQSDPLSLIGIAAIAVISLSAVVSGVITVKSIKESRIFVITLSGLIFTAILIILALFVSGGKIGVGVIINAAIHLSLFLLTSRLCARERKRRTHHR